MNGDEYVEKQILDEDETEGHDAIYAGHCQVPKRRKKLKQNIDIGNNEFVKGSLGNSLGPSSSNTGDEDTIIKNQNHTK